MIARVSPLTVWHPVRSDCHSLPLLRLYHLRNVRHPNTWFSALEVESSRAAHSHHQREPTVERETSRGGEGRRVRFYLWKLNLGQRRGNTSAIDISSGMTFVVHVFVFRIVVIGNLRILNDA